MSLKSKNQFCSSLHANRRSSVACAFTLIEVLIALVILAIAFMAVLRTTQSHIRSALYVKNTLISNWVAMDVYSELQIGLLQWPTSSAPLQGTTNMLQSDWDWRVSLDQGAGQTHFKRIAIDVSQQGKRYEHLIGFMRT